MGRIEQAIEIMRDLTTRPTVEEVAGRVGMSPVAFSRLFTATAGVGPLAYVRRLRLERAAEQLSTVPSPPLVEVAFDAGFESQQTFTRAFTAAFGMPPGAFRKTTSTRRPTMTISTIEPKFDEPSVVTLPPRQYAGFRVTIDGIGKTTPGTAWERLMPLLPVKGMVEGRSFGICSAETAEGTHDYVACVELSPGADVPSGLDTVTLPDERYFVVRQWMPADGFAEHLGAGLEQLWGTLITAGGYEPSGNPDIEVYEDDFIAGQTDGWLTYMVPLKA
jgi:AraC family transcriptional regulator